MRGAVRWCESRVFASPPSSGCVRINRAADGGGGECRVTGSSTGGCGVGGGGVVSTGVITRSPSLPARPRSGVTPGGSGVTPGGVLSGVAIGTASTGGGGVGMVSTRPSFGVTSGEVLAAAFIGCCGGGGSTPPLLLASATPSFATRADPRHDKVNGGGSGGMVASHDAPRGDGKRMYRSLRARTQVVCAAVAR